MNRFTVDWSDNASDQLADSWIRHPSDARAITKAADDMERILAQGPLGNGSPVSEGLRKITVAPLTAFYTVDQTTHTVRGRRDHLHFLTFSPSCPESR